MFGPRVAGVPSRVCRCCALVAGWRNLLPVGEVRVLRGPFWLGAVSVWSGWSFARAFPGSVTGVSGVGCSWCRVFLVCLACSVVFGVAGVRGVARPVPPPPSLSCGNGC